MATSRKKSSRKGKIVRKPHGQYVWEDFRNPPKSKIKGYRTIKSGDHVVRIAILRNGKTKATSIGHPKEEFDGKRKKR